jgi:hypothetical protein
MSNKARNAGKKWSSDSDLALLTMWEYRKPIEEICNLMGRTEMSIASRLVMLDRYPDLEAVLKEFDQRRRPADDSSGPAPSSGE